MNHEFIAYETKLEMEFEIILLCEFPWKISIEKYGKKGNEWSCGFLTMVSEKADR